MTDPLSKPPYNSQTLINVEKKTLWLNKIRSIAKKKYSDLAGILNGKEVKNNYKNSVVIKTARKGIYEN